MNHSAKLPKHVMQVQKKHGKYLFFIDADTVVPEKILQEAISKMEQSQVGGGGDC